MTVSQPTAAAVAGSDPARELAVSFQGVHRSYHKFQALKSVDLDVYPGEFLTLLGPSGCGKTTLLRIAAGFDRATGGRVLLEGQDVTRVPAHKRHINMVFQRSTLFPHLNVFENVAFGLRLDKVSKAELETRVAEALALVKLTGFESRHSTEMSGGQVQRVALARALVKRPKVLLLDEPLSALDLKIRLDMEVELRRIHRETGAVFIYVTHDQREALALSDRIAVFNLGEIQQCGAPEDIYHNPGTPFVAGFVGDSNVIPADVITVQDGVAGVRCAGATTQVRSGRDVVPGPGWLVLRPEQIRVERAEETSRTGIAGVVADVAFRGTGFTYGVVVDGLEAPVKAEPVGEQHTHIAVGSAVILDWNPEAGCVLRRDSSQ